jgi:rSAM/selenodomain-associated transferase 1
VQVLIVAKAPVPGRAKTRLSPPLSADQAAALGRALLLDTVDACRSEEPETALLCVDADDAVELLSLVGANAPVEIQKGRGLADALRFAMAARLPRGPTALVSSDVPGIPPGALGRAATLLRERSADVVLGPAFDGGYWLIAMREFHDEVFREIPWSTPAARGVTMRRCEGAGLTVATLEAWPDIDTTVDLALLVREADALPAPRTRQLVRELAAARSLEDLPPAPTLARSELLANSPWRTVLDDQLVTPDGRSTRYTYLAVPRAVFVVPLTEAGEVVLVRQYRHPVRDWTLEVPAGSVHDGESPREAAERELAEEVGGRATAWIHLTTFYSSSAHLSLRSDAFLATGVTLSTPRPDEEEDVTIVCIAAGEVLEQARAGELLEGQTALAVLLAAPHLERAL